MKKHNAEGGVAIVKKYANRRLYNTESSSYITLEHLAAMTRAGRDFRVVDARTDEDITHNILTQIIMEEESRGETMLPVDFLRQLIAMYGGSMQAVVPGYLSALRSETMPETLPYADGIAAAKQALRDSFPAELRAN